MKLVFIGFFGVEILVLAFFYRTLLSLGFLITAYWSFSSGIYRTKKVLAVIWSLLCLAMAIFPTLPTVGRSVNYNLVTSSGLLLSVIMIYCATRNEMGLVKDNVSGRREPIRVIILTVSEIFILFLSTIIVKSTSDSIANDASVPIINHVISWIILASSFILPLFGSRYILTRLLNIFGSLVAVYLLLSSSYEGLFLLVFLCLLSCWLVAEYNLTPTSHPLQNLTFSLNLSEKSQRKSERSLCVEDFRRAYFFIYFIVSAFFGTGNLASLNSFDVSSVFCFIKVFNPFVMGGLLMLKVLIPILLVTCVFRSIHLAVQLPTRGLLLIVLLMSDFMSLHFFFLVQDTGSWLDIGTSISHYVIVMTIIIFVMIFYALATLLTSFNVAFSNNSIKVHRL